MERKTKREILRLAFIAGVVFFILTSCDPGSTIKYVVINKTTAPLKISYQFHGDQAIMKAIIKSDSNKTIHAEQQLGYVDFINQRKDSLYFYCFKLKQKNRVSDRNFKNKKLWMFTKNDDVNATYTLIVDESYFVK